MSISNAAVQQSQRDVNYLALELNLYISISIGIGTGLDIKNSPPDAKPERWWQFVHFCGDCNLFYLPAIDMSCTTTSNSVNF
jgi:hypothetical protein